jgi:hypothetical protein
VGVALESCRGTGEALIDLAQQQHPAIRAEMSCGEVANHLTGGDETDIVRRLPGEVVCRMAWPNLRVKRAPFSECREWDGRCRKVIGICIVGDELMRLGAMPGDINLTGDYHWDTKEGFAASDRGFTRRSGVH